MEQFIFDRENRAKNFTGEDIVTLKGEEHFHLSRVLRVKIGEEILATDGRGLTCLCVVQRIMKDASICQVKEEFHEMNSSRRKFCIGMAVLRPLSKLEFAIEKCTELGTRNFLLFNTERSEKVSLRIERLRGIARSAVKQSLQSIIPELAVGDNLEEVAMQSHDYGGKFVLHEKSNHYVEDFLPQMKRETSVVALIGPEGGFSANEIDVLTGKGFKSISVGKSRLRSETAAIKIASLLAAY